MNKKITFLRTVPSDLITMYKYINNMKPTQIGVKTFKKITTISLSNTNVNDNIENSTRIKAIIVKIFLVNGTIYFSMVYTQNTNEIEPKTYPNDTKKIKLAGL